jgi:NADPH:quinone reductase-like Zn-dependent oxidoreductase
MRWIRFTTDGRTAYGSLNGDTVSEISGEPWGTHVATGKTHKLANVKLEVPVIPRTFYAAGINYADTHQAENSYLAAQQLPLIPGTEIAGTTADGRRRLNHRLTKRVARNAETPQI